LKNVELVARIVVVGLLASFAQPAAAQIEELGRGHITIMFGEGTAPLGGSAASVVAGKNIESSDSHALGSRIVGGYQFATYIAAEAGFARIATLKSAAAYLTTDTIKSESIINVLEVDLVGHVPLASFFRIDLTAGGMIDWLTQNFHTVRGNLLPLDQPNPISIRRFGVTGGLDGEFRLSEHSAIILGIHVYPKVGSDAYVGSKNGTASIIGGGLHFIF
jgi:hypothetical protein